MAKKEISSNKEKNKTVSELLLESVRSSLYKLKDYLDNIEFEKGEDPNEASKKATSINNTVEKLGKGIETLAILEKKVAQEESQSSKIRGGAKLSMLESGDI